MRDNRVNYIVVGMFVIAMLAALLVSLALLTGRTGPTDTYYAVYDNVSGVGTGTQVLYEGFNVGQVEEIVPVQRNGKTRFQVVLSVREGWRIPADSVAMIAASGLLSAVAVDIRSGDSESMLAPGDEIPAGPSGNMFAVVTDIAAQVSDLSQNALKPLIANLNRQLDAFGVILEDQAPELMASMIAVVADLSAKTPAITTNVQKFSEDISRSGEQLNRMLDDGNVERVGQILGGIEKTTSDFARLTQDLNESRKLVDQVLVGLNQVVADNRTTVAASLRDLRYTMQTVSRSIDTITSDLEGTTRNMHEFSRQVRQNPGLLLGGTAPPDERGSRR